ncbi:MAG: sigma non-opioid intracellular receptor [Mycobacterium sp.]|jgi:hypothetical protein|nr:sigma non-opioid intracellular receptor [Mycobacterium sp.]
MPYKFDPDTLAKICGDVLDVPLDSGERFTALIEKLSATYPDYIENVRRPWIATKAGGILGKISFLYMGLSEYLLIFGSPAETDGYTGRYNFVDVYKVILAGEYVTYDLETDQIAATVYRPGDLSNMAKGHARGLAIQAGSWHLEYGRGLTITAVPFGVLDTIMSLAFKPLRMATVEFAKMIRSRHR